MIRCPGSIATPFAPCALAVLAVLVVLAVPAVLAGLAGAMPLPEFASGSVVLLLAAPMLEEIVFRLGVQERLLEAGVAPAAANLLAASAFGVVHAFLRSPALGVAVLLPALAIGWIYQRRRRLLPCIAAHAGMNLTWLLAATLSPELVSRLT